LDFGRDTAGSAEELNRTATSLLAAKNDDESEPLLRRTLEILLDSTSRSGVPHPRLNATINRYARVLRSRALTQEQILARLKQLSREHGVAWGGKP